MSESIKDNIIFGEPYDLARYRAVIRACGLETDLTLFEHGDQTEIGEKGITLSGGQKARITLARAVYSETAIVLLDGEFSPWNEIDNRHLFRFGCPHFEVHH
jgi:ABC-type bacteriocin/lantibiotic exporter with double-glycine peptidase domain